MKKNMNFKIVFFAFSSLFLIIITYLIYFLVFKSSYYENHQLNPRVFQDRNKYLRGKILDRNGDVLAYSERDGKNQKRFYNYGESFLHPLGYFNFKYGMSGIESTMDSYLKKPNGIVSTFKKFFSTNEDDISSDVKLTLHKDIQVYAYDVLGDKKGSIVVMNPQNGEIYAMVSKPSFNPNYIESLWEELLKREDAPLYNRAINGKYPPGSTFKIVTSSAFIEKGKNFLGRKFLDNGKLYFNKSDYLHNQNEKSYGEIDLKDAFVFSSNVVFGNLAIELGNDLMKSYAERFYFNRSLEVEGLNIYKSNFPKLNSNEIGLIAQSGIGQGSVLTTPILMAMVSSAVANDGILNNPLIVKEILDKDSNVIRKGRHKIISKAITKKTSNTIKEYMKEVVLKNLSYIDEFKEISAGGKTGTADYKINGVDGIPHSWFVGFAPYDNPLVSIAVVVEEGGYGSGIASQIGGKVLKKCVEVLR